MRTTDFSRIYAGVPLNGTAASVTSNSRQHWEPKPNLGATEHWENPPPTLPLPRGAEAENLLGRTMGRFRVVGYLGKPNPKKKARWLLKCACGHYEARSSAAIKGNRSPDHCCKNCDYQRRLKERGRS